MTLCVPQDTQGRERGFIFQPFNVLQMVYSHPASSERCPLTSFGELVDLFENSMICQAIFRGVFQAMSHK